MANEARPHGCEKLSGRDELYRVRVGSHRVVYSIDDAAGEVHVVKVGRRKDVYRGHVDAWAQAALPVRGGARVVSVRLRSP